MLIRTCHTAVMGQLAILSFLKMTNPKSEEEDPSRTLTAPALKERVCFSFPSPPSALRRVFFPPVGAHCVHSVCVPLIKAFLHWRKKKCLQATQKKEQEWKEGLSHRTVSDDHRLEWDRSLRRKSRVPSVTSQVTQGAKMRQVTR